MIDTHFGTAIIIALLLLAVLVAARLIMEGC